MLAAAHLINMMPTKVLNGRKPYECLYRKPPSYDEIKTSGCLCFVHHARRNRDKFGMRSKRCVFVGYPFGKKGWKLYDMERNEFLVSRDVVFDETCYPFAEKVVEQMQAISPLRGVADHDEQLTDEILVERGRSEPPIPTHTVEQRMETEKETKQVEETPVIAPVVEQSATKEQLGRGHRKTSPPMRLRDYVVYNARVSPDKHDTIPLLQSDDSSTVQGKSQVLYPITDYVTDVRF